MIFPFYTLGRGERGDKRFIDEAIMKKLDSQRRPTAVLWLKNLDNGFKRLREKCGYRERLIYRRHGTGIKST